MMFSCTKENEIEFYDLGTEFYITTSGMTSLDEELVVSIENPLMNLTSIDVINTGVTDADGEDSMDGYTIDLGSISLSDGIGSVTYTGEEMGLSEIGYTAALTCSSELDGKAIDRSTSITLSSPFTTVDPEIMHYDKSYYFNYSVEPALATVSAVEIEIKTGSEASYSAIAGSWAATDSILFLGTNYDVNDTIFVKIIATAGTKIDSTVAELVVSPVAFDETDAFTLDSMANLAYDFILAVEVDITTAGDSADIELTSMEVLGGFDFGFELNNNAELIAVSSAEYGYADSIAAVITDFSSAVTSVDELGGGETYVYRTRRGTGTYSYGYLKVVDVVKPGGVFDDSYVEFEIRH